MLGTIGLFQGVGMSHICDKSHIHNACTNAYMLLHVVINYHEIMVSIIS